MNKMGSRAQLEGAWERGEERGGVRPEATQRKQEGWGVAVYSVCIGPLPIA